MLTLAAGNTVFQDSLVFRIKYAYAQFNLDDWMTRGSWVRFGDPADAVGRLRGRDLSLSLSGDRLCRTSTASDDDDLSRRGCFVPLQLRFELRRRTFGLSNGENYQRVEVNDQKGFEFRGTVRPFAGAKPVLRGLRAHFVCRDHYASGDDRDRVMGNVTYEHNYIVAGFDYLSAKDQPLATAVPVSSNGYSIWTTPRLPRPNNSSWEALLRYDHWTPNTSNDLVPPASSPFPGSTVFDDQKQNRTIVGVAYWFPHQGNVSTAILVDYDGQSFDNIITRPTKAVSVHGLLNF